MFEDISPEVGEIDEAAVDEAMSSSPDDLMALLGDMLQATDEELRRKAKELAARLVLDRARIGQPGGRGTARMRRVPADYGGDIDLDASMDAIIEARSGGRAASLEEIWARDWARTDLAICVVLDTSGSMSGDRLTASALSAAACAWRAPGELSVLQFAKEVTVIRPIEGGKSSGALVGEVLGLRGHGVTGLAGALKAAADELGRARASRRVVLLLSDCRATDDEDPIPFAKRIDELLILTPDDDTDAAEELVAKANGKWRYLPGPTAAPQLINDLLG
ncbi:MAG: VWA domain-containing protein [Cumulibacter sp.]